MGNCLVTKLKGNADNDNPNYLGMIKVHVNTLWQTGNKTLVFLNTTTGTTQTVVVGSRLLGGKTFVNGKTEIEEGDTMQFAPGDTYELLVPKYVSLMYPSGVIEDSTYGLAAFNMDDYDYLDNPQEQSSSDWGNAIYLKLTEDGEYMTGNLNNILKWFNPEKLLNIRSNGTQSGFSLNINTDVSKFKKLKTLYLAGAQNATGNARTFLTNYSTANGAYLKTRNDNLDIRFNNSGIEPDVFIGGARITITFNGTSTVSINLYDSTLTTVLKTYSYDIDTDTLTET